MNIPMNIPMKGTGIEYEDALGNFPENEIDAKCYRIKINLCRDILYQALNMPVDHGHSIFKSSLWLELSCSVAIVRSHSVVRQMRGPVT